MHLPKSVSTADLKPVNQNWGINFINLPSSYRFLLSIQQCSFACSLQNVWSKHPSCEHIYRSKVRTFWQPSALHLYPILIDLNKVSKTREQIFNELREIGIGVNVHYIPIHTHPFYKKLGFKLKNFPNANLYYKRCLSIPMYAGLKNDNQEKVINLIRKFYRWI